jgi:hypothetical protein
VVDSLPMALCAAVQFSSCHGRSAHFFMSNPQPNKTEKQKENDQNWAYAIESEKAKQTTEKTEAALSLTKAGSNNSFLLKLNRKKEKADHKTLKDQSSPPSVSSARPVRFGGLTLCPPPPPLWAEAQVCASHQSSSAPKC